MALVGSNSGPDWKNKNKKNKNPKLRAHRMEQVQVCTFVPTLHFQRFS
jgi:hypothetical protein